MLREILRTPSFLSSPSIRVSPGILAGESDDEFPDIDVLRLATAFPGDAFPSALANPARDGAWRDDGGEGVDGLPDFGRELSQPAAFDWSNRDPFGQLAAENLVLDLEVVELPGELAVARHARARNSDWISVVINLPRISWEERSFWHPVGGESGIEFRLEGEKVAYSRGLLSSGCVEFWYEPILTRWLTVGASARFDERCRRTA